MLGRLFNQKFKTNKLEYKTVWGDALDIMRNSDLTCVNLETTITNSTDLWPDKAFNYKMDPERVEALTYAKIDVCNIANNHILDFKKQGMLDTQKHLKEVNIDFAGAGLTLDQAREPVFRYINGVRILFFGASDHYDYWESTPRKEGLWFIDISDPSKWEKYLEFIREKITEYRADITIFSIHWGSNYVEEVEENIKEFGKLLLISGVDLVHGHSAHHILPMEKHKVGEKFKYIFYSLGDLIDDYDHSGHPKLKPHLSLGISIEIRDKSIWDMTVHCFNHSKFRLKKCSEIELLWNKKNLL